MFLAVVLKAPQVNFQKTFHHFTIDTSLQAVVPYRGSYYCLKSDGRIFVIDSKTNRIDTLFNDNSSRLKLSGLYLTKDTLISFNNVSKRTGYSDYRPYFLNSNGYWIPLSHQFIRSPIFEDDKFIVTSTCSGEWGGTLYFEDKATDKSYECECTCEVNLIKTDNKFHVTASLSHLRGFTELFDINDPLKLKFYNLDSIKKSVADFKKKNPGKIRIGIIGEDESKSNLGKSNKIDSVGITIATSFLHDSTIYYVVEKYPKVMLDKVIDKKLTPVEDWSDLNIWSDYSVSQTFSTKELYTFSNPLNTGFLLIDEDKLSFFIFQIKHK